MASPFRDQTNMLKYLIWSLPFPTSSKQEESEEEVRDRRNSPGQESRPDGEHWAKIFSLQGLGDQDAGNFFNQRFHEKCNCARRTEKRNLGFLETFDAELLERSPATEERQKSAALRHLMGT